MSVDSRIAESSTEERRKGTFFLKEFRIIIIKSLLQEGRRKGTKKKIRV